MGALEVWGWDLMGTSTWGWQGWGLPEDMGMMGTVPMLGPALGDVWDRDLHGDLKMVGREGCEYWQEGWWGWG